MQLETGMFAFWGKEQKTVERANTWKYSGVFYFQKGRHSDSVMKKLTTVSEEFTALYISKHLNKLANWGSKWIITTADGLFCCCCLFFLWSFAEISFPGENKAVEEVFSECLSSIKLSGQNNTFYKSK